MKIYRGELAGIPYAIKYVEDHGDALEAIRFSTSQPGVRMALDTEATTWDIYEKHWRLRLFQFGTKEVAYVIPVDKFAYAVKAVCSVSRPWAGHNAPHDVRTLDAWSERIFGEPLAGDMLARFTDTYILSMLRDTRSQEDGGIGHGLKDLGVGLVDATADDGEVELKAAFKKIKVPVDGEIYKSGPRKGTQKYKSATIEQGYALIPIDDPAYVVYSGMDIIIGMHVVEFLEADEDVQRYRKPIPGFPGGKIEKEHRLQYVCEKRFHRKGFKVDVPYLEKMSAYYGEMISFGERTVADMGLANMNSPQQVVQAFLLMGAELKKKTKSGALSADREVLVELSLDPGKVGELASMITWTKKMQKAKSAWIDNMLRRRDKNDRVHAGINTLQAVTTRMSIDNPPMQQLPADDPTIRDGVVT